MVTERTIIILITIAILMSVISIAVTMSTVNTKMIPKIQQPKVNVIPDEKGSQVSLVINKPATP